MVTENVNIAFRSTGIPIIKRQIDELGESANRASRGFFLLQRSLYTLGGFGLARMLTTSLDALTNMENRLKLTTSSSQQLESVQQDLFDIARRSRSSWEGVAEIYNRTALSAQALGISQQKVLRFTESVAKAAAMSGATTQESRAALIQLGQAVASNRLGGDELRSILEQLPLVADYIAQEMTRMGQFGNVTRGELRKLGSEGKITADIIINAFNNAAGQIDAQFQGFGWTIGQALERVRTNFMDMLDDFDDATGFSNKLAGAIVLIADNLGLIIGGLAAVAAGMAASFGAAMISSVFNYINGLRAATVQQTAVLNRLVAIRAATLANAQADVAANAARQIELQQNLAKIAQKKALLLAEARETEFVVRNNIARNIQTGRFTSLAASKARLEAITISLSRLEAVEAAQAGRLAQARLAQAGATNALAGAQARLGVAQAAQAGLGARLAAQFPLIAGAVNLVRTAISALWGLLVANPIGATIAIIAGIVMAFMAWGNEIKVTQDGVVGLKDFVIAAFQLMWEAIAPGIQWLKETFNSALNFIREKFNEWGPYIAQLAVDAIYAIIDTMFLLPRVVVSVVGGIMAAWDVLPAAAADIGVGIANGIIAGFEMMANGAIKAINFIISALNKLLAFVGADKAAELFGFSGTISEIGEISLGRMTNNYAGAGKTAGQAFQEGFGRTFDATSAESLIGAAADALAPIGQAIVDRARQNIANNNSGTGAPTNAPPGAGTGGGTGGGKGGGGSNDKNFNDLIAQMNQEIALLQLSNKERTIQEQLLAMEKDLKRNLTDQERELAIATIQRLEAAKVQAQLMEDILGPGEKAIEQMAALNVLYQQGKINIEQYTTALREMRAAADEASGTLFGGFRAAIAQSIQSTSEFGKAIGQQFVGFVESASDAIVEFAKTGKINIKSLFQELFANLLKLAAQRLLLMFLGNILGIPVNMGGGGLGLMGMATGGSILPSGPGSTDSQIVAFKKRPDERVDVLTPGQQAAQRNGAGGGSNTPTIVSSPPVNVAAVLSPSDIVGAFEQEGETVLVNMISRNASTIRRIVGG